MTLEQAIALVEEYLRSSEAEINEFGSALPGYVNPNVKLQILKDQIEEYDFGWVLQYDSAEYIETGNFRDGLVGKAPLIVDRNTGFGVVNSPFSLLMLLMVQYCPIKNNQQPFEHCNYRR